MGINLIFLYLAEWFKTVKGRNRFFI